MSCPAEIAEIIAEIIQTGLLRIRSLGWSGDAGRCAIEADHIHNLPGLLTNYSPDLLKYYWEVERPSYLGQTPSDVACYERLWSRLSPHAERALKP